MSFFYYFFVGCLFLAVEIKINCFVTAATEGEMLHFSNYNVKLQPDSQ